MKTDHTKTAPRCDQAALDGGPRIFPGVLLAWAPARVETGDRSPAAQRLEEIISGYYHVSGNLTKLEEILTERGLSYSRRWLATYLERWGV